jgi:hypothetical protein
LREEREGQVVVPARHGDQGWFDYRPPDPLSYVYLYALSQRQEDWARIEERFPDWTSWRGRPRFGKAGSYAPMGWLAFVQGMSPGFPDQVLEDTYSGICQRLEHIEKDDWNVEEWDVHHWQNLNPVIPEGLVQMAMGTPATVYHGGLLHSCVHYFDPHRWRPGLPEGVAALVERVTPQGVDLVLVNVDPLEGRELLVQAGAFGEHQFTEARLQGTPDGDRPQVIDSKYLIVRLGPSAQARLQLGMRRFANRPCYEFLPLE